MDTTENTRVVFDRIQQIDPDHAMRIFGYLLLQDHSEQEIARLASCPHHIICHVVFKAKTDIQMLDAKPISPPTLNPQQGGLSPFPIRTPPPLPPPNFQVPSTYWDPQSASNANPEYMAMNYMDSITELQKQTQLLSLENHHIDPVNTGIRGLINGYNGLDAVNFGGKAGNRRSFSQPEFPFKICYFFNKGFCKHGSNCRYTHAQAHIPPELQHGNDANNEDQVISPGSLAQLETEIIELLKERRGNPLSIASLPMVYYEKYQKVLQADGYLTESQRHGKSGFSLTKLLVQLNGIRLIGRPHGQHGVVLAEDAPEYIQKGDYFAQNIGASRQIYFTFPADSTFTEEDVANYFNTFGTVEDVRIPCQQRRMFGFVTFVKSETVKMILDKAKPRSHYVCGSRVLVKPYREKAKGERKNQDKMEHTVCCSRHDVDMDSEVNSIPRCYGTPRSLRRKLIEEQEQALEFQRRRRAQLQFTQRPLPISPPFGFSMDEPRISNDHFNFQPAGSLSSVLNDKSKHTDTDSSDGNSNEGLNLPESPFAFQ